MTLKEGDIVWLKTGSPAMTIQRKSTRGMVLHFVCNWFSGTELKEGNFTPEQLTTEKPKEQ